MANKWSTIHAPGQESASVKTANYTAVAADSGSLLVFNSASAITLTLPAAPPSPSWHIGVENIGAGLLTINRNGLTIDGAAANLSVRGTPAKQGLFIYTNGTNYFAVRWTPYGRGNTDIVQFADQTGGATEGNIAVYDAGLNVKDGGIAAANIQSFSSAQATVTVDGRCAPWRTDGPLATPNAAYNVSGINSSLVPAVGMTGLTAGDRIKVAYVSGTTSIGGAFGYYDANGGPAASSIGTLLGATPPPGYGGLYGAFTDGSGVVKQALAIGNGPKTCTVPVGATQIQFGVDDGSNFLDNGGSFVIAVVKYGSGTGLEGDVPVYDHFGTLTDSGQTLPASLAAVSHRFIVSYDAATALFVAQQPTEADLSLSDITTNNVTSTAHGLAPKSPADATKFLNGAATPAFAQVKDSDLSTSDVTTNDVASTKHGFAPKSPSDATKFLNGAATPAFAQVKDSDLSTSDITTNNVSTSKHGFAPKLPSDATKYLDGTGVFSVPAGGGGGGGSGVYPTFTVPASADFSWVNQLSTVVTDYSNRETFSLPTNATDPNWRLWVNSSAPAAHHQITAAFNDNHQVTESYFDWGIIIRDSSTGKFIFWGLDTASSGGTGAEFRLRVITFNSATSAAAVVKTAGAGPTAPLIFLRIKDDGSTRSYQYSLAGWDYATAYSEASGTFVTPNQAGLGMGNFTGSTELFAVYHYLQESI